MHKSEKVKFGCFGSASNEMSTRLKVQAVMLGESAAAHDVILCTGACEGLPHVAALEVDDKLGIVWGFSPAKGLAEHIYDYEFPERPYNLIFTGMGKKGRNLICTRTCDAGICISGGQGTMHEFITMNSEGSGKIIGLLEGSGGFVDEIIIPGVRDGKMPGKARIIINEDPEVLVNNIFKGLKSIRT